MDCWDFLRFQKGFISRVMAYWELPGEAPKVQKSVSDAYPGNIGHLDHYVVFGTQSGAVQDKTRHRLRLHQYMCTTLCADTCTIVIENTHLSV